MTALLITTSEGLFITLVPSLLDCRMIAGPLLAMGKALCIGAGVGA